jgi:hypothetical protein
MLKRVALLNPKGQAMTKLHLAGVVAGLSVLLLAPTGHLGAAERPPAPKSDARQPIKPVKVAPTEEPGVKARRELDEQSDRLEAEARRAMQSICRGC